MSHNWSNSVARASKWLTVPLSEPSTSAGQRVWIVLLANDNRKKCWEPAHHELQHLIKVHLFQSKESCLSGKLAYPTKTWKHSMCNSPSYVFPPSHLSVVHPSITRQWRVLYVFEQNISPHPIDLTSHVRSSVFTYFLQVLVAVLTFALGSPNADVETCPGSTMAAPFSWVNVCNKRRSYGIHGQDTAAPCGTFASRQPPFASREIELWCPLIRYSRTGDDMRWQGCSYKARSPADFPTCHCFTNRFLGVKMCQGKNSAGNVSRCVPFQIRLRLVQDRQHPLKHVKTLVSRVCRMVIPPTR